MLTEGNQTKHGNFISSDLIRAVVGHAHMLTKKNWKSDLGLRNCVLIATNIGTRVLH